MKRNKFLKGSGIVVVIFAALATSVYMISTFADYEHYENMVNKFEKTLSKSYDEKIKDIDTYYRVLENRIKLKQNYILE